MPLGFTDFGTYGVLNAPGGDVILRPGQYAQFGVGPSPAPEESGPTPDAVKAASLAPPISAPAIVPPDSPVPANADAVPPPDASGLVSRAEAPLVSTAPAVPAPPPAPPASGPPAEVEAPQASQAPPAPLDLSSTTYGQVFGAQQDAVQQGVDADQQMIAAQVANNEQQARAAEARNAAVAAEEARFAERQAREQQAIEETTARYGAAVKEFADKKVDRSNYRVSTGQWLGIALSGLGSALKGQGDKNPALDYLERQIQQYVDDEYRAKDSLGQSAAMVKDQLGVLRDQAANTQAQKQLAVAGIMERHLRDLDAMIPRMENRQAAAQLSKVRAAGAERVAGLLGGAVQLQHAEDQQKAAREQQERESRRQAALGYARIAEEKRQFNANYGLELQKLEAGRQQAAATAQTEAEKRVAQIGVPDLAIKDGSGNTVMYQAREGSGANPGMVAQDVVEKFAAAKTLDNLVAEGIRLRDAFKGDFNKLKRSEEWQKYTANIAAAGVAWSKLNKMGTWDNGTEKAVLGAMGGDPNRDGYLADLMEGLVTGRSQIGLEQFRQNAAKSFNDYAGSMRRPGTEYVPWEPQPINFGEEGVRRKTDETVDTILGGKTPAEITGAAEANSVQKGMGYAGNVLNKPGERVPTAKELDAAAEAFRKGDPTGQVTREQAAAIDALAATATSGEGDRSVAARTALIGLATKRDRPQIATRALETLARLGDEEALADVERALVASAGKSEREQENARQVVNVARWREAQSREAGKPPDVKSLAGLAAKGDRQAAAQLLEVTQGRPASPFGKPPTSDQRLEAVQALRDIAQKRGGR